MNKYRKYIIYSVMISAIFFALGSWYASTKYGHIKRGNDLLQRGKHELAIFHYNKVLYKDEKNAEAYCKRGIALSMIGNLDQAFTDFNKAIEIAPDYIDAYFNRGVVKGRYGNFDAAIADFNKVIEMNPRAYEAFSSRAIALEKRSALDVDKALSDYDKALEINPAFSEGYYGRAKLWRKEGKYDRAIADYDMAIKTDKRNFRAYGSKAYLLSTCPDSRYRNGKEAVQLARVATELDYGTTSLSILAAAHAENGEFDEAVRLQVEAISLLETENNPQKMPEFKQQLESYQTHKPWRKRE